MTSSLSDRILDNDRALDIEDYSGLNMDSDVLDTIVETSHSDSAAEVRSDDDNILDEDHWASDSFEELQIERDL